MSTHAFRVMKTYLTYGSAMAGAGFLLVLVLYIFGFHSDPAKLGVAQAIQGIGGLGICVTCIVLGTKAHRAQVPATVNFGYGSALGAGVMITLFAALIGIVTNYLYGAVINPHLTEVLLQAQADKLEAQGMSADKIEGIQKMTATFMKPAMQAASSFVFGMIFGTIISLITAAIMKRPAVEDLAGDPPPLS